MTIEKHDHNLEVLSWKQANLLYRVEDLIITDRNLAKECKCFIENLNSLVNYF